jgi:hypothetical protein
MYWLFHNQAFDSLGFARSTAGCKGHHEQDYGGRSRQKNSASFAQHIFLLLLEAIHRMVKATLDKKTLSQ